MTLRSFTQGSGMVLMLWAGTVSVATSLAPRVMVTVAGEAEVLETAIAKMCGFCW
jgi:hypothetical protein